MEFIFTKPALICQDDGGAIAMCKSDKRHSRRGQIFVHVNVHIARDAYNQRACCYSWVPIKYKKGDMVNNGHQPADNERLVIADGVSAGKVEMLWDKGEKFKVDGWLEKVMEENAAAA